MSIARFAWIAVALPALAGCAGVGEDSPLSVTEGGVQGGKIDADGLAVPVRATAGDIEAGAYIELVVPADVLAASAFPAVIDPEVSPEIELDPPVQGFAAGDQLEPAVGALGAGFFAVWTETRDSSSFFGETAIWGARVSSTGDVLDPGSVVVAQMSPQYLQSPRFAGGPGGGLVVFTHEPYNSFDTSIFAKRVDAAGQPVGGAIPIALPDADDPAVATDGEDYLVSWRAGNDTRAARIAADGTKLDTTDLTNVLSCGTETDAAFGGGTYLVVGPCSTGVRGRLVSPGGALGGAGDFTISTEIGGDVRVAFDGTSFVVTYEIGLAVAAVRVSPAGAVLDAPIAIATNADEPAVASAGAGSSFITWKSGETVRGARLSTGGTVLDPAGVAVLPAAAETETPAIAAAAGQYLVLRKRNDNAYTASLSYQGGFDVDGIRVGANGTPEGAPFAVAVAASGQGRPSAAFDGENHLVVWEDYRHGEWEIYGVRIAPDGTVVDDAAFPITNRPFRQARPAVAFGAGHYLVAWTEGYDGDFYTQQVGTDGALIGGPVKVGLSGHQAEALAPDMALAGSASKFLLAYEDYELDGGIRGLLLNANGTLAGTVPAIASSNHYNVAATSDGKDFLVAFNGNSSNTFFSRVTETGTVVQNTISVSETGGSVAATFDGTNYLVTWGGGAVRVSPVGALLDIAPIELGSGYSQASAASADGTGFVVAYRDEDTLYVRRIGADGMALGFQQLVSEMDPYYEEQPVLSSDAAGRTIAAFTRFDANAPYGIRRIRARLLTSEDASPGTGGSGGEPGVGGGGGGSPGGGAGGAPAGPNDPGAVPGDDAEDDGGCGCATVGASGGSGDGALAAALAIAFAWSRRRGRRSYRHSLSRAGLLCAIAFSAGCADGEPGPNAAGPDGGAGGDGTGACTEATVDCNADPGDGCEIDVFTHAQHCGACGLTCGGGSCVDGVCQPFAVRPVEYADDLTVHDGTAYLSHGWDAWIEKIPLMPNGAPIAFGVGYYPDRIAAGETSLVFTTDYEVPDMVMRSSFDGLAPTSVAWGTYVYADLEVAGDRAVWLDAETTSLKHAALDGSDPVPVEVPADAVRLATNATHVAFREGSTIALVHLASSFKAVLAESATLSHPALTADHAYWVQDGTLERWAFADGAIVTLAEGLGTVDEIEVSAHRLYLSPVNGPLFSVDLADGGRRVDTDIPASNIAADALGATWVTNGVLYHQHAPDPAHEAAPVCGEIFADCNGDAADGCETSVWSDRAHCGGCGQACDGPCAMGTCQATVLASQFLADELVLLGDQIVFSTYEKLAQMPKSGGPITDIAATGASTANSLLVEGASLYMCLGDNILRFASETAGLVPIASGYGPYGLASAGGNLFFGASSDVFRVSATGGTPTMILDAYAVNQDFVNAVAANGSDVFVATDSFYYAGGVFRIPAGGGTPQLVLSDPEGGQYSGFRHLLADATTLFAGHDTTGLYAVPKAGGPPTIWAEGEGVLAMTQDAERVYWVASKYISDPSGGYNMYRLVRATKGGTTVETIADLPDGGGSIAVDDAYIYYQQSPLLLRRPK